MKICFIGCVEFSDQALKKIIELERQGDCKLVSVVTKKVSSFNSDFADLCSTVVKAGKRKELVHYYASEPEAIEFIRRSNPDVVYCFGWSHLLSSSLLNLPKKGVIGFHPAVLPENRGRHPIIWALALGLRETASTFFKMDSGADSGDILSQRIVQIQESDDARTLYDKITATALIQIEAFTRQLAEDKAIFVKQDHSMATYWRKRSAKDGLIDWRMDAKSIHDLIRALCKPYPGAEFYLDDGEPYKVWSSMICSQKFPRNLEPGKILSVEGDRILVKSGGSSAIWLNDIEPQLELGEKAYL